MMEATPEDALKVDELSRTASALIATASLLVKNHDFDIQSVKLDMPLVVQDNLELMLLPYLNAVKLDGFQTKQTRKIFVIGNTGRFLFAHIFCYNKYYKNMSTNSL